MGPNTRIGKAEALQALRALHPDKAPPLFPLARAAWGEAGIRIIQECHTRAFQVLNNAKEALEKSKWAHVE